MNNGFGMSLVALVLATGWIDAARAEADQLTGTVVVVNQASDTVTLIDLGEFSTPHDVQWVNENQVVCTVETNQALLLVNVESGEIERVFETGNDGSHMLSLSREPLSGTEEVDATGLVVAPGFRGADG